MKKPSTKQLNNNKNETAPQQKDAEVSLAKVYKCQTANNKRKSQDFITP